MSNSNDFSALPPSKRFKLLRHHHHQEEELQGHHHHATTPLPPPPPPPPPLPQKKKKKKKSVLEPPSPTDLPAILESRTYYCLPAKKRVLALPQPKPTSEEAKPKEEEAVVVEEEEGDDGVFCSVCRGTDGDPSDPIVFCDGCDLAVHASCYGNPLIRSIPDGDWFCHMCLEGASTSGTQCYLCPAKGGAMKRTTTAAGGVGGCWAHVLCALLVPEVFFSDPVGRDGVDLSRVPVRRWLGRCYLCGSREGCALECSEPKCQLVFHVTCAVDADLCLEYRQAQVGDKAAAPGGIVVGFCHDHTLLWRKQQVSGKFTFVPRSQNAKR